MFVALPPDCGRILGGETYDLRLHHVRIEIVSLNLQAARCDRGDLLHDLRCHVARRVAGEVREVEAFSPCRKNTEPQYPIGKRLRKRGGDYLEAVDDSRV